MAKMSVMLNVIYIYIKKRKYPIISYLFYKTLFISIICGKWGSKHKVIFKEK